MTLMTCKSYSDFLRYVFIKNIYGIDKRIPSVEIDDGVWPWMFVKGHPVS